MLKKFFTWASGRHTGFAIFFTVSGTILQVFQKLDLNYIALIGAIHTFVFAHSAKEDYFSKKDNSNVAGDTNGDK